jgi:peroxiredoxin
MAALEAGATAPAFTLSDMEGQPHTLGNLKKDGLVLAAFYKVGCGTCQFTAPYLDKFYQAYRDKEGFQLWGVSQDTAEDTTAFLNDHQADFPQLLDETHWASADYGMTNVPSIFLIDQAGQIIQSSVGFSRADLNAMSETVARHVGADPVIISEADDGAPDLKPG